MVANHLGNKISKNFYYDDIQIQWSYHDEAIKEMNKGMPRNNKLISYDLKVSRVNGKILEKFTSEKRGIESFEWQCKKIQPTQKF